MNNKIYIVWFDDESGVLEKVFKTRELAEGFIKDGIKSYNTGKIKDWYITEETIEESYESEWKSGKI